MSDLFPKTKQEPINYGALEESMRNVCIKNNLKDVDGELDSANHPGQRRVLRVSGSNRDGCSLCVFAAYIAKCVQLYETTVVRHGLMLVGPSGSGKTKVHL